MEHNTGKKSVDKAGNRLAQLTMTISSPSTGATPEALEKQARRQIEDRLGKDPGLPVDSPTMSFWQDPEHPFAHIRSASLPQDADIAIIGSGITSVSTAQHLLRLEPHLKIIILEARAAISGATGRNGGHIKASPWGDYHGLKTLFGKESGMKIMKFRMAHLDAFSQEAAALGKLGEPGLVRRTQSLSTSYDPKAWEGSKMCLNEFLKDFPEERGKWTAIEDPVELKKLGLSQNACGTVRGPEGAAWPYRFVGAVLRKLLNEGHVTLETHTPVTAVERSSSPTHPYRVHTSSGSISARDVIHCTNGYAAHLLPALRGKLWPFRGQMTVQSVPPHFPRLGAERSWSAIWRQGFDYITQSPGEDGYLYWGGGFLQGSRGLAEQGQDLGCSDDSELSLTCLEQLKTAAGRALEHGNEAQIVRKWTGIMGCTGDGLPLVGRLTKEWSGREDCEPQAGGEWIAAGFNGFGMVNCWLSGKGLAHLVTGRADQARPWFPIDEFACTKERLDGMSPKGSISLFLDRLET